MFNRKQLLSQYAKNAETYDKRHSSTQSKMEERRVEAANMINGENEFSYSASK